MPDWVPYLAIQIVGVVALVFLAAMWPGPGPQSAVAYETCRTDCEATGRGVWAWSPSRCECTP